LAALQARAPGEGTTVVRDRVARARAVQRARFDRGDTCAPTNAALGIRDIDHVVRLCEAGARMLSAAVGRLALSARAYGKVLRVARTIADLAGAEAVAPEHVAEAIGLRVLDRGAVAAAA
jgi:magnesium chelatase family protein